jgi:hypothetical protein
LAVDKDVVALAVAVLAALAFTSGSTLLVDRWPFDSSPPTSHDFLDTEVSASTTNLPLGQVRLLTKRLVLLAAAKAEVYWGGTRCESIRFDFRHLADRRIAEASWSVYLNSIEYLDCRVTFNTDPTRIKTTFWHYCAAVVHEFGHLSGQSHVGNPERIMYRSLSNRNVPPTCKKLVYP